MLSESAKTWLQTRRISASTAEAAGLVSERRGTGEVLIYPYRREGAVVNRKYRNMDDKSFSQDKGGEKIVWNYDALNEPEFSGPIIVTEGEMDALAAMEAGFERVVSVPDGAPAQAQGDDYSGAKYAYLPSFIDAVRDADEIILAFDSDAPGRNLLLDISSRIGRARVRYIETYPKGCKDLNDALMQYGVEGVKETIKRARWWKITGVCRLEQLPPERELVIWKAGLAPEFDKRVSFCPGQFSVWTGMPGNGKSAILKAACIELAKAYDLQPCIAGFEDRPRGDLLPDVAKYLAGVHRSQLTDAQWKAGEAFMNERMVLITSPDGDEVMDVPWLIERMEVAARREGSRMFVIDPWTDIEHDFADQSETQYTRDAIGLFRRFARRFDAHVAMVCHPSKPPQGAETRIPTGYSISGCYSDDTEVLTERGWLRHAKLRDSDAVACFDPETGAIQYQRPSRIIRKEYEGEMFAFKGYGYDLLVTPEHRMVVEPQWKDPAGTQAETGIGRPTRWKKGVWQFAEAREITNAPFMLPLAGSYVGEVDEISVDLAAIAGWYAAEGCVQSAGVSISQAEGEKADAIEALLTRFGAVYSVGRSAPGGKGGKKPMKAFYIGARANAGLVSWLREHCGVISAEQRVPGAVLWGPEDVRRAFLDAFLAGDGHYRTARGTHSASTTSPHLRDQIQQLCIGLGMSCGWSERAKTKPEHAASYHLSIGSNGRSKTALRPYRNLSREAYSGLVWCLTVPTGAYVVRRNGKAAICGNSAHWVNKADLGVTVHAMDDHALVRVWKSKRHDVMGRPGDAKLTFDPKTGRYGDYYDPGEDAEGALFDAAAE